MFAPVVTIQLQPEKIAEAGAIMEEVAETLQSQAGFHEAILLADHATGQGQVMTLWETEEEMRASEGTIYRAAMERLAATFAAPPQRQMLTVIMHATRSE